MTGQSLVEVHPCERHRSILHPSYGWFRSTQLAEACPDCRVVET